jgi:hypothetical protein
VNLNLRFVATLLFAAVFSAALKVQAQITVTTGVVANNMVQKLVGTGVTFTNATLTCNSSGSGSFVSTNTALGIDSGIVLTTGYAKNTGSNDGINNAASVQASHDRNTNSMDADLYAQSGLTNNSDFQDLCKLE